MAAPQLVNQFVKGLKCCNDVRPMVVYLDQLAAVAPQYRQAVDEVMSMMETLQNLCEVGRDLSMEAGQLPPGE